MTDESLPSAFREYWRLPVPHSARGRVLVAIRFAALLALVAAAFATPGFFTTVSLF